MDNLISEDTYSLYLKTIDEEQLTLRELISQTTYEPILNTKLIVGRDPDDNPYIVSFSAWTENFVMTLVQTGHGCLMVLNDRNYG